MNKNELRQRFKEFAIDVARMSLKLPLTQVNKIYSGQIIRSATSSAANYSASLRAKSARDFINKFKIVEEELDETLFFFDLIEALNPNFKNELAPLSKEGNCLLSIIVRSLKTLRLKHAENRKS